MTTNRDALNEMFKGLRRRGLLARQRFSCCGSCAAAALGHMLETRPTRVGAAYYHRQDAERLDDRRRPGQEVYIGFGARDGGDDAAVGAMIVAAAREVGLETEWDGSPAQRICVKLPGGLDAPVYDPIPAGATPVRA